MNRIMTKCYLKTQELKAAPQRIIRRFTREERGGAEIIAAIILLAVVVVLGVAFREKIQGLLNSIWGSVDEKAQNLGGDLSLPSAT